MKRASLAGPPSPQLWGGWNGRDEGKVLTQWSRRASTTSCLISSQASPERPTSQAGNALPRGTRGTTCTVRLNGRTRSRYEPSGETSMETWPSSARRDLDRDQPCPSTSSAVLGPAVGSHAAAASSERQRSPAVTFKATRGDGFLGSPSGLRRRRLQGSASTTSPPAREQASSEASRQRPPSPSREAWQDSASTSCAPTATSQAASGAQGAVRQPSQHTWKLPATGRRTAHCCRSEEAPAWSRPWAAPPPAARCET
mmetsp:Transcript_8887/g.26303  ORF Transcript_8887/g.26303 Transcript_8887/m.26303 type:complete len:256 (-) Transcript_8887:1136-1903(-)